MPAVAAYGVPDERIALLANWTHVQPSTSTRDEARHQLGWPLEQFIVAHTGNIGLKQDLATVVEAGRALIRMAQRPDDVQLLIIGDGNQRAAIADLAVEVPTVTLIPPLERRRLPPRAGRRRRAAGQRARQRRRHVDAQQAHLLPRRRPAGAGGCRGRRRHGETC